MKDNGSGPKMLKTPWRIELVPAALQPIISERKFTAESAVKANSAAGSTQGQLLSSAPTVWNSHEPASTLRAI